MLQKISKRLCPHRGVGDENTLAAIQNGLHLRSFLLEFDIQYIVDDLYLGHPPSMRRTETLHQALQLFTDTDTLPKVDLKLNERTKSIGLWSLIKSLDIETRHVLVNISGDLSPEEFMKAEQVFIKSTPSNILLNIDLARYGDHSVANIDAHLNRFRRKPFSISPNLDAPMYMVDLVARRHNINQIHFWSDPSHSYDQNYLVKRLDSLLNKNFEVYFDIKQQNIITPAKHQAEVAAI